MKEARRVAVEALLERRATQRVPIPPSHAVMEGATTADSAAARIAASAVEAAVGLAATTTAPVQKKKGALAPHLSVLCRTHEQVVAAAACAAVDEIVIDFLELDGPELGSMEPNAPQCSPMLPNARQ